MNRDTLREEIEKYGELRVWFTKKDSTEREMRASLPANKEESYAENNPDMLVVWDLDSAGWRVINCATISKLGYLFSCSAEEFEKSFVEASDASTS